MFDFLLNDLSVSYKFLNLGVEILNLVEENVICIFTYDLNINNILHIKNIRKRKTVYEHQYINIENRNENKNISSK